ncbi:TonB-dependent receptor domain-containing protein [Hyphomonas sp. NPDC076900]|uniref:TonB-dependent receptor domain-containing protein n=1 Tax=unclassified Hyphomonas TaxID=2630699 RepID=UPI003CFD1CAD
MKKRGLRYTTVLGMGIYLSTLLVAHAEVREFNLPEGDATKTIPSFARQSGVQIVVPADRLRGKKTREIKGKMDTKIALEKLLEGTDLKVVLTEDGKTFSLRQDLSEFRSPAQTIQVSSFQLADNAPQAAPSAPAAEQAPEIVTQAPVEDAVNTLDKVVIVGSQIAGARPTGVVPVTVMGEDEIAALGISSGEDLFRSLPIAGDVSFNTQTLSGGSQGAARGDVSSINLRGLGSSYTLLLLNGRRTVPYGLTQGRQESSYNANAIPVFGLQRLEILRDGAAALYGSDAIAGVVNNVLLSNYNGLKAQVQYGGAEGTNLRQFQANLLWGSDFADGRGNFTTYLNYGGDTKLYTSDQEFTASLDLRPLIANTSFAGNTAFDTRGTSSPWGGFQVLGATSAIRANGVAITDSVGRFHIQPVTNAGCLYQLGNGLCIDDGVVTGAADRNLRFDSAAAIPGMTVTPSIDRINIFNTLTYELPNNMEIFAEAGIYYAKSESMTTAVGPLAHTPITIPADSYYNPFGPVGSPNRIDGLDIPAEGVDITVLSYLLADVGGRLAQVESKQHRLLLGLKGETAGWNWETAALYSDSSAEDIATNVQNSLWHASLSGTTPAAYNPFNGGNVAEPNLADTTLSTDLSSFLIDARRYGRASLGLVDFKLSRGDIFNLPAGGLGLAAGVEVRWETSEDDRDSTGDFTTNYYDTVTGLTYPSDTLGASAAWDVRGNRTVYSAFAELAVPIISPEMNIPLARAIDLQFAGRYEDYSDVGSVAKPKVAGSWDVFDGLRLRSSWQQGFVAPTLQQLVPVDRPTSQTRLDDVLCEADLRAGRITAWGLCSQRPQVQVQTTGNANLKPEESESLSYGLVIDSNFIPEKFGHFTITYDNWKIDQENKVGALSAENALTLDYLLRVRGSSNPNVVRAAPTPADIAFVEGTGLAPIGEILYVITSYDNLDSRTIEGYDVGLTYEAPESFIGKINAYANISILTDYFQNPSAVQQEMLDAQAANEINAGANVGGAASLLQSSGNPELKWNAGLNWRRDRLAAGLTASYTGEVYQYNVVNAASEPWEVSDQLTFGLWGEYGFEDPFGGDSSVRLGVRNLTDEAPPLSTNGYLGNLYQPYGRYWYARLQKTF